MVKPRQSMQGYKRKAVILCGYQRSGKGTQARRMAEVLHSPLFETGEYFRELMKKNPDDPKFEIVKKGGLIECSTVLWQAKLWILNKLKCAPFHNLLLLDGIPRKESQLDIIQFLQERGYEVKLVWITTPVEVCNSRPVREGRFEDKQPSIIKKREQDYLTETLPILDMLPDWGISVDLGNLLLIDNTDQRPVQTAEQIIKFVGIDCQPEALFPNVIAA